MYFMSKWSQKMSFWESWFWLNKLAQTCCLLFQDNCNFGEVGKVKIRAFRTHYFQRTQILLESASHMPPFQKGKQSKVTNQNCNLGHFTYIEQVTIKCWLETCNYTNFTKRRHWQKYFQQEIQMGFATSQLVFDCKFLSHINEKLKKLK